MLRARSIALCVLSLLVGASTLWRASAQGSQLSFALNPPGQAIAAGTSATFAGTLSNTGGTTLFLNDISFTLTQPRLGLDTAPFFTGTPFTLASGQVWSGTIFRINVAASTPPGTYTGRLNLLGGGDLLAQDLLASQEFTIEVSNFVYTCAPTELTFREGCVAPPTGLVAWWAADGNATDIAGNHCGTLQSGAAYAQGKVGQTFSFDGADDFVSAPDSSNLDITGNLTIETWVNPTTLTGDQRTILDKRDPDDVNVTYSLFLQPNGRLAFYAKNAGASQLVESTGVISTGAFTHVAVTINDAALTLFINGVADTVTTYSVTRPATAGSLTIGKTVINSAPLTHLFAGLIDDPAIYNRALSAADIKSIYDAGGAGKCQNSYACAPQTSVVVPYEATGYRYRVVNWNEGVGFEQPGFDDSDFSTGNAGFGAGCDFNAGTPWPVNTDMLVRKRFQLGAGVESLRVGVAIDNDVQVWINGHDVSDGMRESGGCAFRDRFAFDVPQEFLKEGENLIAARGHDYGFVAYLDLQVTATACVPTVTFSPALSVTDVVVKEPEGGTATAEFNVALVPASALPVTVNFNTSDGTAGAPDDYAPASGTLTFNPGETLKSFGVTIKADAASEADETFFVNLSNAGGGAFIADAQGQGMILSPQVTALTSSVNPSVFGQSVTLNATVSGGASGSPVTFFDGPDALGTATLDANGQATFETSALGVGTHTLTAAYGDQTAAAAPSRLCKVVEAGRRLSGFEASFSPTHCPTAPTLAQAAAPTLAQLVNKADTGTSLKTTLGRALSGQNVTLRAAVSPNAPGAGTPTGTVTFRDGVNTLGTATLNPSGQAAFNTSSLSVGNHSVTVTYEGDGNFNGSASGTVTQAVNAGADLSVEAAAAPTAVVVGAQITYTINVRNNGSDPAANVLLEDPLPAELAYVSSSTAQGSCAPSPGGIACALGGLDAGASVQVSVTLRTTAAGELTNVFSTSGDQLDPSTENNVAAVTVNATPALPGSLVISEFRFRGPGAPPANVVSPRTAKARRPRSAAPDAAANDEFVEFYNNTDSEITVTAADGSAGWALVASDGGVRFVIPNGTTIPARGHLLAVNSNGYSLSNYGGADAAAGDISYAADIPDAGGVALFRTAAAANFTPAQRLDAAGYQGVEQLYREGLGFPAGGAETTANLEHSFFRDLRAGGFPKDTDDNLADFLCVDPNGSALGRGPRLGAPGPENLASPRNVNHAVGSTLLDTGLSAISAPNRVRDFTTGPPQHSTFGTLSIRRTVINTTGGAITRLRFRIMDVTTYPPTAGSADLRALTSADVSVTVNDTAQCAPNPAPCQVNVRGTVLEQPAAQANGGGWNSTLAAGTVTLATPLAAGAKISVQFLFGVQRTGSFRFYVNVESLP